MIIPGIETWVTHMTNPFVLMGFGIMVFALIIGQKNKGNRIVWRGIYLLFILVLIAELVSIVSIVVRTQSKAGIVLESHGDDSPNIISSKNVKIEYGQKEMARGESLQKTGIVDTTSPSDLKTAIADTTVRSHGAQSPNVAASDSVHINYRK